MLCQTFLHPLFFKAIGPNVDTLIQQQKQQAFFIYSFQAKLGKLGRSPELTTINGRALVQNQTL